MDKNNWILLFPKQLRRLPIDLKATIILTIATILSVTLPIIRETPIRIILGLPFILFLPGYVFIATLFPEKGTKITKKETNENTNTDNSSEDNLDQNRGIDGIERVALSFGTSIAITPLIGLILNFTPFGIRFGPIIVSIGGFTLIFTAIAAYRRQKLPIEERFKVPYKKWVEGFRSEFLDPESRTDKILNILLLLSILLAITSVGYAVFVPKSGEKFTEFYLLTENENGELTASNYPTEFRIGQSKPIVVGIGNHEHTPMNYNISVQLQKIKFKNTSSNNSLNNTNTNNTSINISILDSQELDRLSSPVIDHNTSWHTNYMITPTMAGDRQRLLFLLYKGEISQRPSINNSYRNTHLWVNVSR